MDQQGASWLLERLKSELGDMYADTVWQDMIANIELYRVYDGPGQDWAIAQGLDYEPTKKITNLIKHLIKEGARFMMSRAPEITIQPLGDDETNKGKCAELESWLRQVLEDNGWQAMLPRAHRDCAIAKRVALKLSGKPGMPLRIRFRPSLEFFHDVGGDDASELKKAIFYYHKNANPDPKEQRTWYQRFWVDDGKCMLSEGVYDGEGNLVEGEAEEKSTGLDEIPVYVIINDGLTGDTLGESDVADMLANQGVYNRLTSDDIDALRFNMFPQRVFTDASQDSLSKLKLAPGAMADIQTDPMSMDRQAQYGMIETKFSYDARFEHTVDRIERSLYQFMNVPEISIDDLKALGVSGKAMKALYWPLICRCDERWATWDSALKWMVRMLVKMAKAYGAGDYTAAQYTISIEHLYPIPDDEEDERKLDMQEVATKARSRKSYIEKWQPAADAEGELAQIAAEARMAEDGY